MRSEWQDRWVERLCQGNARQLTTPASAANPDGMSPILRRLDHHLTVGDRLERMASRRDHGGLLTLAAAQRGPARRAARDPQRPNSLLQQLVERRAAAPVSAAAPLSSRPTADALSALEARAARMTRVGLPQEEPPLAPQSLLRAVQRGAAAKARAHIGADPAIAERHRHSCARVPLHDSLAVFSAALAGSRPPSARAARLDASAACCGDASSEAPRLEATCAVEGVVAPTACAEPPRSDGANAPPARVVRRDAACAAPARSTRADRPEARRAERPRDAADLPTRRRPREARDGPPEVSAGVGPPLIGANPRSTLPRSPTRRSVAGGPRWRGSRGEVRPRRDNTACLTRAARWRGYGHVFNSTTRWTSAAERPPRWPRRRALHDTTRPRSQAPLTARCGERGGTALGRTRVTSGRLG